MSMQGEILAGCSAAAFGKSGVRSDALFSELISRVARRS